MICKDNILHFNEMDYYLFKRKLQQYLKYINDVCSAYANRLKRERDNNQENIELKRFENKHHSIFLLNKFITFFRQPLIYMDIFDSNDKFEIRLQNEEQLMKIDEILIRFNIVDNELKYYRKMFIKKYDGERLEIDLSTKQWIEEKEKQVIL